MERAGEVRRGGARPAGAIAWLLPCLLLGLPAAALEPFTLQLKWKHQFQFAGYYVAQDEGYYREAGLDVKLVEADERADVVREVLSGRADAGVGTTELLLERARGRRVVVLAVIFQHSPLALAVRRDHGIANVHQLAGRGLQLEPGSAELQALLRREGLEGKVTLLPHPQTVTPLLLGDVDAASVYTTDEPWELERAGVPYLLLSAREAGVDFYGDNLFTSEERLGRGRDSVAAFREASLRGWRRALADPPAAIQRVLARTSRKTPEHLAWEAERTAALVQPDVVAVGYMYEGRWRHIAETYRELGMLDRPVDLAAFLYDPASVHLPGWVRPVLVAAAALALLGGLGALAGLRAKRRVERREAQLRRLVERAPLPMIVSRPDDGRVLFLNERAAASFGLAPGDIPGLTATSLHADPITRTRLVEAARAKARVADQELRLRRRDGTEFPALVSASLSVFDGEPAIVSAFVDLTAHFGRGPEASRPGEGKSAALPEAAAIVPICAYCKDVRDEGGGWEPVDRFLAPRAGVRFSHGICPRCLVKRFPETLPDEPDDTGRG